MGMITAILGFLTGVGPAIAQVASSISNLQIARLQADTAQNKAAIDGQLNEAHDRMLVLQAEAGSRINAIIRGGLAFGPMTYLNKVFVWDKVIGSFAGYTHDIFTTDPLDTNLWTVVTVVLSFYFLYDINATWRRITSK